MCNFLSGIVLPDGQVITSDYTDSHCDIILSQGIKDDGKHLPGRPLFAPVECISDGGIFDWTTYKLNMDGNCERPMWFDDDMWVAVENTMKTRIKNMIIVTGERDILLGGRWLIGGDAKIKRVISSIILNVGGSASITNVGGNASITDVGGNASITNVGDNASITDVRDSASITNVWDNASITDVWDNASITNDKRKKGE